MCVNGLQRSRLLNRGRLLTRRSVIRGLSASLTIGHLTACDTISSTPHTTQGRLELLLQEPATIDPGLVIHSHEATVTEALFEPLVHAISNGAIQPGAAESWEVSADGRGYRFRLYNDRLWTSGEEVIAEETADELPEPEPPAPADPLDELTEEQDVPPAPDFGDEEES